MAPPAVVYSEPPRFDCTNPDSMEEAMQYLHEHGYVVIGSTLDHDQVLRARALLWDWFENSSGYPISRSDPSTWTQWPKWQGTGVIPVYVMFLSQSSQSIVTINRRHNETHSMYMCSNGIGQSALLWFVRTVPAVRHIFEKVWHTEDLIVSFDGAGVFRPWQYDSSWKTTGAWYHVDQNGNILPHRECVQGLVSLYDQTASTGGLVVVPDSQKLFASVTERHARSKGHLVRLSDGWDDELLAGYQPILVGCKAGDLVLWDSRTIHCNTPALEPPAPFTEGQQVDLLRAVAYVCMVPREKADEATLQERRTAVEGNITTSHWPQFYFPNYKPQAGAGPRLNAEQRRLI